MDIGKIIKRLEQIETQARDKRQYELGFLFVLIVLLFFQYP